MNVIDYYYWQLSVYIVLCTISARLVSQLTSLYYLLLMCKEVTYRVYSFVTTSQGYPDILSCDLKKHVSSLLDDVIIESHGIP